MDRKTFILLVFGILVLAGIWLFSWQNSPQQIRARRWKVATDIGGGDASKIMALYNLCLMNAGFPQSEWVR